MDEKKHADIKQTVMTPAGKRYRVVGDYDPETLTEKEYKASLGSKAALKKHKGKCKAAVEAGEFDWAKEDPYAACQAAHIAIYGKPTVPKGSKLKEMIREEVIAAINEKKDRCYKIAKRKYDVFPSAYASGAIVKCRQGKIWKDLKGEGMEEELDEKKKKKKAGTEARKESSLRDWFGRKGAPGKKGGWVDCNAPIRKDGKIVGHKPCGRQKGEKRKYPACRPTSAACKERGKGKTWGKKASKKKKKKNEAIRRLHEALSLSDSAPFSTPAKLSDNPYRPFSDKYYDYVKDQRSLWRGGKVSYDHLDEEILKSDLGEQVLHEGEMVPLDMPMPLMEAKLNGREVELNSPMRSSGPKKYKVYVKDPKTGNVKTIHFGDKKGGLAVKIHDAGARKSYVARHKCEQANDKMKPSYWACRIPRYSEQLGLSKMSYRFW